jgi:hypothetical protein
MKCTSPLLENMSGKLGGSVASRARGGIAYFRALVIPTNPDTSMQKAAREAIASASARWRSILTEAQQEAWWDVATGAQTGQTLYTKINQPRIFAVNTTRVTLATDTTLVPIDTPNALFTPSTQLTAPTGMVIDDSANTLVISGISTADPWQVDADENDPGVLYIYGSHQQNSSRFSRQHPYQLLAAYTKGATNITTVTVNLAPLGFTTQTDKVMYIKLRAQDKYGGLSTDLVQRVAITP